MRNVLKEKECTEEELRDTKGENGPQNLEVNLTLNALKKESASYNTSKSSNERAPYNTSKSSNESASNRDSKSNKECTLTNERKSDKENLLNNQNTANNENTSTNPNKPVNESAPLDVRINDARINKNVEFDITHPSKESVRTSMQEIIRVRCIKHIYPDKTEVSLCGLDFVVHQGERVAILGPNGAGKTTLLSHILGLLKPVEGEVSVFGRQPSKEQREVVKRIGVVFQNSDEQIIGPTVYDDIAFSPRNFGYSKDEIRKMVDEVSKRVGISHLLNKVPHYLSGGQKKKVALAGAMVMRPELLILDEPFNGLDPEAKEEIIELLREINEVSGTAILMTSHDINFLPEIVEKIYILHAGKIVRYGEVGEVLRERDFMYDVSLRPPLLVELFTRLQAKGVPIEQIPINVDQAEKVILRLLQK